MPLEHPLSHLGQGEVLQRPVDVATFVAVLESPGEHGVERCTGDDAELPGPGHGVGQLP